MPERKRWAVVVPSNRPDRLKVFLDAWDGLFHAHDVSLWVVDDTEHHDIAGSDLPERIQWVMDDCPGGPIKSGPVPCHVVCDHRSQPVAWAPAGSDMCRSYGFWSAWKYTDADFILSLDDDTLPLGDPFAEYEAVFDSGAPFSPYLSVGALTSFGGPMRGFPFADRDPAQVVVQWGGWSGVLDYDAVTQLKGVGADESFAELVLPVPVGAAVTGCAMNMAFRREWTPMMWQLPLFEGRYNRWGDIWSGLFAKRVADAVGAVCVINGRAQVRHERASDPVANLAREAPGVPINDYLWWQIDPLPGSYANRVGKYREVTDVAADYFGSFDPDYADHFVKARDEWLALFRC